MSLIGRTVAHYRVDGRLGEGGMGVLFRAEDLRLGRPVALKFLREESGGEEAVLERFRREARAASALNNPHICTVHDVGLHEGRPFIVMELLVGRTLSDRLKDGPLPAVELVDLAVQMADALRAAHGKGIVHRDLKPGNVFLTDGGLLKILDFGVAKLQHEPSGQTTSVHGLSAALLEDEADGTATGVALGTLPYMSPEQARGREIDTRSDLFSLGAVLYEMAAGRRAFPGRSTNEVVDAILNHTPLPPSRLEPGLPRGFDDIVSRALQKSRETRYQTAEEVLRDLRCLAAGQARPAGTLDALRRSGSELLEAVGRWWRPGARAAASDGEQHIDSLAVMPFQSLSGGGEHELLADGITEALISRLSQVRAVRVISRTSVTRYRGTTKTAPQIARELGVDGIVEGSLSLSGSRVSVTARLIHATRDESVWSGTYERELRDVLSLQSDLAQAVAGEIRVALTPEEQSRLVRTRPVDPEVHFSFLRGRFLSSRGSPGELTKAIKEFEAAVERDPTFAPAWAGIATAYTWLGGVMYGVLPPRDALPRARAAAERALEIEPSADAWATLGYVVERYEFDLDRAREAYRRALDVDPGSAIAHEALSQHLPIVGRFGEAIEEATRALEIDPFSLNTRTNLALRHYIARDFAEAARLARQTLALDPAFAHSRLTLGLSLLADGHGREALPELERFRELSEGNPLGVAVVAYARARLGEAVAARTLLEELNELAARCYVGADRIALVHVGLGDTARALGWLKRAIDERSPLVVELGIRHEVDDLRAEPRFREILRRNGVPLVEQSSTSL